MYYATALGESLIDFTPFDVEGKRGFIPNPGGAPVNLLAMLGKLGMATAFIGKVGNDAFGTFLKSDMEQSGIDTKGLLLSPRFNTTLAFVHLDARGDRSFSFYRKGCADTMLEPSEIDLDLINSSRIFHFGSLSLTDEPVKSAVKRAVAYARSLHKIISYDPNYRPRLWGSEAEAKREITSMIPSADILKVSEEEMQLITGETDIERGAEYLRHLGPKIVLVTRGEHGSYFLCAATHFFTPAVRVEVVDTVGSGDAFLGSFLYGMKEHLTVDWSQVPASEYMRIVKFANLAGSMTAERRGAIPAMPSLSELTARLAII